MGHELTLADRQRGALAAQRVKQRKRMAQYCENVAAWDLSNRLGRAGITALSVETTLHLGVLIANHEVPVPETAAELHELAKAYKIAHTIMRLEHNESTSNAAHASLSPDERTARLAELRARLDDGPS